MSLTSLSECNGSFVPSRNHPVPAGCRALGHSANYHAVQQEPPRAPRPELFQRRAVPAFGCAPRAPGQLHRCAGGGGHGTGAPGVWKSDYKRGPDPRSVSARPSRPGPGCWPQAPTQGRRCSCQPRKGPPGGWYARMGAPRAWSELPRWLSHRHPAHACAGRGRARASPLTSSSTSTPPGPTPTCLGGSTVPRGAVRLRASTRRAPMPSSGPPPPQTSRPSPATPPAWALGGGGASRAAPRSLSADRAGPDLEGRGLGGASPEGRGRTSQPPPPPPAPCHPGLQALRCDSSADLRNSGDTTTKVEAPSWRSPPARGAGYLNLTMQVATGEKTKTNQETFLSARGVWIFQP